MFITSDGEEKLSVDRAVLIVEAADRHRRYLFV